MVTVYHITTTRCPRPVTTTPPPPSLPPTYLSRPNPGHLVQEGIIPDTPIPHRNNHNPARDSVQPHQPATVTQKGIADPINLTIRPTSPSTSLLSNNHSLSIANDKRSSEETVYGRPNQGPRPRFAHEDKFTPHLPPHPTSKAANRRATKIREWYRAHTSPIHSSTKETHSDTTTTSSKDLNSCKDPAQPHSNDLSTLHNYSSPPAVQ